MFGWRSWAQARLSRRNRARQHGGIRPRRPDEFYGDVVAQQRAMREVYLAHPAAREPAADLVLAIQERASGQHRGDCTWSAIESGRMLRAAPRHEPPVQSGARHLGLPRCAVAARDRKPLFASLLTLLWGPLGLAFWVSDRPLATTDARRGGTAWVMAQTFVMAISALVPATFLLIAGAIRDRLAVPGSLGATVGVLPAALIVTAAGWALLAGLAFVIGRLSRNPGVVERGISAVKPASLEPRLGSGRGGRRRLRVRPGRIPPVICASFHCYTDAASASLPGRL